MSLFDESVVTVIDNVRIETLPGTRHEIGSDDAGSVLVRVWSLDGLEAEITISGQESSAEQV